MASQKNYRDPVTGWALIRSDIGGRLRRRLFRQLTRNSLNLFLRGRDIISVGPMINGVHEPAFTRLIRHCARHEHGDFLIDIGANIGLTSCQNGADFKRVICFEPNPMCAHVLRANTAISLPPDKVSVHEYGLGDSEAELELWIPRHNWGGAFVRSEANAYSDKLLAQKDCFDGIDPANYIIRKVPVRTAATALGGIFAQLEQEGLANGVIKIDVEGMELTVLRGIAQAIPPHFRTKIVFENWDREFAFDSLHELFTDRLLDCSILQMAYSFKRRLPKLVKLFAFAFGAHHYTLVPHTEADHPTGDVMLSVGTTG